MNSKSWQAAPERSLIPRLSLCAAVLALSLGLAPAVQAATIDTTAREAILVDAETGALLFEKDADLPAPPASMSKIMTAYMVFEALKEGRLKLDDKLPVSEKAWRMGGSKMFVEVGTEVSVEDLIRGVVIQSGNDACIVLAEALAGSEEAFAEAMTEKARELGMNDSVFANATGWPHPDHRMSARDLAILAQRTIEDFPEYFPYYSEINFTFSGIRQGNRNPLLYKSIGADGLKTGHTEEAGYGLTATAKQGDRRLILVVTGLSSVKERSQEAHKLMSWGFREFNSYALFDGGAEIEQADVWLGEAPSIPLVVEDDVKLTLPRKARKDMTVKIVYDSPIPAPIAEGDEVAELVIEAPDVETIKIPLKAGASVEKLGPVGRMVSGVKYLVFGSP